MEEGHESPAGRDHSGIALLLARIDQVGERATAAAKPKLRALRERAVKPEVLFAKAQHSTVAARDAMKADFTIGLEEVGKVIADARTWLSGKSAPRRLEEPAVCHPSQPCRKRTEAEPNPVDAGHRLAIWAIFMDSRTRPSWWPGKVIAELPVAHGVNTQWRPLVPPATLPRVPSSHQGNTHMTTATNGLVAIYPSHTEAESAIKELQRSHFDMTLLSIVGRDYHTDEHVVGYYTACDRMKYWGKLGAFWGGIWGLLLGSAFFMIPGVGPMLVAGPLVGWIVGALEGAVVVGGVSAIGAGLLSLGIPKNSVLKYEIALGTGKFALIAHGTAQDVERARAIIGRTNPESVDEHTLPVATTQASAKGR